MTQDIGTAIRSYRAIVLALALGYWIYRFFDTNLDAFGWQFRFLTIWGMTANLLVAIAMMRLSLGLTEKRHETFVSVSAVLGMMVVYLYWQLYFIDPKLVSGDGGPSVWHQEYYFHLVGPLLMWIDAFLILGVFTRILRVLTGLLVLIAAYVLWIEIGVGPMNDAPVGSVTSGMPYPFLNDMDLGARMMFYAQTCGTGLLFMCLGWGLSALLRRTRR
ncbi:MAG: hypothetical protein ACPGGK_04695 [Pikeienuella sp.]